MLHISVTNKGEPFVTNNSKFIYIAEKTKTTTRKIQEKSQRKFSGTFKAFEHTSARTLK